MEGSEKGLFPSKSTANPKFSTTGYWENNENDSSQDYMISEFQNHNKTVAKHFMSPTVSATSKDAAPRKKILAERNENSRICDVQIHRNSNIHCKKSPRSSSISHPHRYSSSVVSSYDHASKPEADWETNFLNESSEKAYDPLMNYLSPRPKYLRFNPNRRHEIFYRLEREGREKSNSSSEEDNDEVELSADEIENTSFSPLKGSFLKLKNGEKTEEEACNMVDDFDEEEEEELEEGGWCLRGVLKFLLTLIACLLSISYICSMNSPTPSPTQQTIWDLREGCLTIKKQTLEFISMKMHEAGFFEVNVGDKYIKPEERETEEDNYMEIEESVGADNIEDGGENMERHDEKEFVRNKNENGIDKVDKAEESEGRGAAEFGFEAGNFEQLRAAKSDETMYAGRSCLEKEVESSYICLNEENINKIEVAETEIIGVDEAEHETASSGQLIGAKTDENVDADLYLLEKEIEGSNPLQEHELSLKSISEEKPKDSEGVDDMEPLEELIGSHEKFTDSIKEFDDTGNIYEVGMEKVGWNTLAIIELFVVSILSTLLALVYHSKKSSTPAEESEPRLKPHKFALEEKVTPALPSIERKVEFFSRPSLSSHSTEEASKVLNHHIHVPTVELIGEINVGQVSSLRSYGMTECEESNAALSENNVSLPQLVSALSKPSAVEHSVVSSPYGGFTAERKILKKKGGQSREAIIEATPVRRSSRLQKRAAITSP